MKKRKKMLLCEFCEETNSFNSQLWGLEKFLALLYCEGALMRLVFSLKRSPVGGMLAALRAHGAQGVCGIALRSGSGGLVDDAVLDLFIEKTLGAIETKGPFDGVFLSLHGATATPAHPDACGHALAAIRAAAGPKAVITVACDLHANITKTMSDNADFICGFQTYPHVDLFGTGYRAADLALRKLEGEALFSAYSRVGMIVPASGYTTKSGAFKEVMDCGAAAVAAGEIEDYTVFQMQPWLDVPDGASCAVSISANANAAQATADALASALYDRREKLWPSLERVEDIVQVAACNKTNKPVVLGDAADSPNAGAVGDSVFVIQKLLEAGSPVRTLTCVADPQAARAAHDSGTGTTLRLRLGGGFTPGLTPLEAEFTVQSLHNGSFKLLGPVGKGLRMRLGKTAVLVLENISILVCETPAMCGDLNFFRAFGLDPLGYQLVVIKANTSFRENYESIAASIHMADTPGAASANLMSLPYRNLPQTIYPFCERDHAKAGQEGTEC